jgi:transmembrane sensor
VVYQTTDDGQQTAVIVFNTLTNPKGSKAIDIALSDGSHVWLNAGSSITYPVAFAAGKERSVKMTGEAYYEIMHRDGLAFVVQKENTEVKVLGTHFNVKAYDNEPDLKVTLLEGSVRVSSSNGQNAKSLMLKPNQQAVVTTTDMQLTDDADTEQAMAWKNGMTSFHSANVPAVLREIERWYNIETEIKGTVPERSFNADVSRGAALSEILKVLELNHVKYEYDAEKRKLVVIP